MTERIAILVAIGLIVLIIAIVLAIWKIYSWYQNLKRDAGKYSKLDKLVLPHTHKTVKPSFMEKVWKRKGLKFFRVVFYNKDWSIHSVKSVSEARITNVSDKQVFHIKNETYFIDFSKGKTQNGVTTLEYVKGFPKPISKEIPEYEPTKKEIELMYNPIEDYTKDELKEILDKNNIDYKEKDTKNILTEKVEKVIEQDVECKLNVLFVSAKELYGIITDTSVSQLLYTEATDKLKTYLSYISMGIVFLVVLLLINLYISIGR